MKNIEVVSGRLAVRVVEIDLDYCKGILEKCDELYKAKVTHEEKVQNMIVNWNDYNWTISTYQHPLPESFAVYIINKLERTNIRTLHGKPAINAYNVEEFFKELIHNIKNELFGDCGGQTNALIHFLEIYYPVFRNFARHHSPSELSRD